MDDQRRLRVHLSAEPNEALALKGALVPVEAGASLSLGKEICPIGARVHDDESALAILNSRMDARDKDIVNHQVVLPVPAYGPPGSHPAELDGLVVRPQGEAGLLGSGGPGD